MNFVENIITDTGKFSSFLDNFAIPNKKIALILGLLMYYFKLLPYTVVIGISCLR